MGDGRTLDLTIPAGIQEGQTLRLRGKAGPVFAAGLRVTPWSRSRSIRTRSSSVAIAIYMSTCRSALGEAVLGGKIDVPTIDGPVAMTVPKGANTGTTLRLKGRGIGGPKGGARGNQYVRLSVTLPPSSDEELEAFLERWSADHPYNPRKDLPDL